MKKILFIIVTVALFASHGFAQVYTNDFRTQIMFGLKLGANYSNVYDAQGEEFIANPKFGLATGAFVAIPIGKFIGVQPELLFSQKGFKATGIILGSSYSFTRTTNYIALPLLFSLKPIKYIALLIGPQFSYLIKQNDVFETAGSSIEQELEFENDNIRKNSLGFLIGADITINRWVIGGRAGWDLFNNNGNGTSTTPRYKNAWSQVTFGYRLYN